MKREVFMSTADPSSLSERLQRVAVDERAARCLLDGPVDLGVAAVEHLRAGWLGVMEIIEIDPGDEGGGDPADAVAVALGVALPTARQIIAFVRAPSGSGVPGPDMLESQLFRLQRARHRLSPPPSRRVSIRTLIIGGLVSLLAVVVVMASILRPVWQVSYFSDANLTVAHSTARARRLGGFWGLLPAATGLPRDQFSSRWRTCAAFSADTTAVLKLGSDDGARLFVDGQLVIDNWRTGAHREVVRRHPVTRGTHEIVIEHFDEASFASLTFDASLEKGSMYLMAPDDDGCAP